MRIDADAHVDENEETWADLRAMGRQYEPVRIEASAAGPPQWRIDGHHVRRFVHDFRRSGATRETSELMDPDARVRHMDELKIDVQVLYPSSFIRSNFKGREELEVAMARSYNRWIAGRTESSHGRLRWIAVLPMLSMDSAVDELKWAKDHGACGIFKKGYECGKTTGDPYFFPLYEAASQLDIPICIHTGTDGPGEGVSPNAMSAACGFLPLVNSGVMEQFPTLRVGFVEAGASWIPFLLSVDAASVRRTHLQGLGNTSSLGEFNRLQFNQPRIFVACQTQDDLPYILQFGTEDNLMVGTDYTHNDVSAELLALSIVDERASNGEFSAEVARKIVEDNPGRFYGI